MMSILTSMFEKKCLVVNSNFRLRGIKNSWFKIENVRVPRTNAERTNKAKVFLKNRNGSGGKYKGCS
jgi:hypothetical protein